MRSSILITTITLIVSQAPVCRAQSGSATLTPVSGAVNASSAFGLASLSLNGVALTYSIVAIKLSGPIIAAHFHQGAAGASGGVIYTICSPCLGYYLTGTWPNASAYLSNFANAGIYINIHTTANGNGEIRGQVQVPFSSGPPYMAATVLSGPSNTAFGVATLSLTSYGGDLTYTIVATNLTGPITMAHFHAGAAGASGNVLSTICSPCSDTKLTGTWTNTTASAMALSTGNIYINLHTAASPAGEIRGQVPVGLASMMTTTPAPGPKNAATALAPFSALVAGILYAFIVATISRP